MARRITINPIPLLVLLGFTTALGAVLGSWLVGLTVGLGIALALLLIAVAAA